MYKLIGFQPPHEMGFGHWGFSVSLDQTFAKRAMSVKMPESNNVEEMCRSILKAIKMDERYVRPIQFWEDTCLATNFTVAGNACGLDADWDDVDDIRDGKEPYVELGFFVPALNYHPHNVDTQTQAVGLLSLFAYWYNFAECMIYAELQRKNK